ncbi:MAG: magnesium-translocating P-type ATPase [Hyphomicrobiaceae bacterium]|nr:magnesium-translocating P-type ATPase [Hyphomicrobiaceae bacterium]
MPRWRGPGRAERGFAGSGPAGGGHKPYWTLDVPELLADLGSRRTGLSASEARARLERYGPNRLADEHDVRAAALLARQFANPLVLILIFGASISLIVREWTEAVIILAIVLGSTMLGFWQEYGASRAVAALRDRLLLKAVALRDDAAQQVDARSIVPGDVVLLSAGNLVPADGVLIEARDFLVSEAALTGESFPVEKTPGRTPADAPLRARTNAVFCGTSVRSGTATMVVAGTGAATVMGDISRRLAGKPMDSEFARGLRRFGYMLTQVMMAVVLFVVTVNLVLHRPPIESLLFAVALAVGLSPELLPAIVSVTLSKGARAMARQGVIVRRLDAIENLGSIDILCTDKTGTLTRGVVELTAALDASGEPCPRVQRLAFLNASLQTGIDNPLDKAIEAAGARAGLTISGVTKIDEIPYDFLRKRLTIVIAETGATAVHTVISKGAFDNVLSCCTSVRHEDRGAPLDDNERRRLVDFVRDKGALGCRVLGLATRAVAPRERYGREDEADMTFEGFLLFFDPLKDGIAATVSQLAALGIRIKVITGDSRHVAAHVGEAVGLDPARMLTGEELNRTRNEALLPLAEHADLFVEVDPQQKERIVHALQRRGHAVGYMGDGINDAPALNVADVGISVDQAVDIARESADVVLLRRDLEVLRSGVLDGRRTFANTLKYIFITTSANFGNMISMAAATLVLPFLPLTATQILLNNFLSDFPSVAISTDNVDHDALAQAQRWSIADVRVFMIVFGLISTVFDLLTFGLLLYVFQASEPLFQTTWFVVSVLTELAVVLVLRTHQPALTSTPSRILVVATAIVAAIALSMPYLDGFAAAFGLVALPFKMLAVIATVVVAYVLTTEWAKTRFYARRRASKRVDA